jgi:hypothetical protein
MSQGIGQVLAFAVAVGLSPMSSSMVNAEMIALRRTPSSLTSRPNPLHQQPVPSE